MSHVEHPTIVAQVTIIARVGETDSTVLSVGVLVLLVVGIVSVGISTASTIYLTSLSPVFDLSRSLSGLLGAVKVAERATDITECFVLMETFRQTELLSRSPVQELQLLQMKVFSH